MRKCMVITIFLLLSQQLYAMKQNEEYIKLISRDNKTLFVKRSLAQESVLLKNLLEDTTHDNTIEIPVDISHKILHVIFGNTGYIMHEKNVGTSGSPCDRFSFIRNELALNDTSIWPDNVKKPWFSDNVTNNPNDSLLFNLAELHRAHKLLQLKCQLAEVINFNTKNINDIYSWQNIHCSFNPASHRTAKKLYRIKQKLQNRVPLIYQEIFLYKFFNTLGIKKKITSSFTLKFKANGCIKLGYETSKNGHRIYSASKPDYLNNTITYQLLTSYYTLPHLKTLLLLDKNAYYIQTFKGYYWANPVILSAHVPQDRCFFEFSSYGPFLALHGSDDLQIYSLKHDQVITTLPRPHAMEWGPTPYQFQIKKTDTSEWETRDLLFDIARTSLTTEERHSTRHKIQTQALIDAVNIPWNDID